MSTENQNDEKEETIDEVLTKMFEEALSTYNDDLQEIRKKKKQISTKSTSNTKSSPSTDTNKIKIEESNKIHTKEQENAKNIAIDELKALNTKEEKKDEKPPSGWIDDQKQELVGKLCDGLGKFGIAGKSIAGCITFVYDTVQQFKELEGKLEKDKNETNELIDRIQKVANLFDNYVVVAYGDLMNESTGRTEFTEAEKSVIDFIYQDCEDTKEMFKSALIGLDIVIEKMTGKKPTGIKEKLKYIFKSKITGDGLMSYVNEWSTKFGTLEDKIKDRTHQLALNLGIRSAIDTSAVLTMAHTTSEIKILSKKLEDINPAYKMLTIEELSNQIDTYKDKDKLAQLLLDKLNDIRKSWKKLPPRNQLFTGRVEEFTKLETKFKDGGSQTITLVGLSGLGGIGKSSIALEYAYRKLNMYDIIWWIDCTKEGVQGGLASLGRILLPHLKDKKDPEVVEALNSQLSNFGSWLIIFDDSQDIEELKVWNPLLPSTGTGHHLTTSRNRNGWSNRVDVGVLEKEDAITLMVKIAKKERDSYCEQLVERLGYLALAIRQAGAYIFEWMTYAEYLEEFNQDWKLSMKEKAENDTYQHTVATTWNITLKSGKISPTALHLLYSMSFLAPTVEKDILLELFKLINENGQFRNSIKNLLQFSLIQDTISGYQIHGLLSAVIRDQLDTEQFVSHLKEAFKVIDEHLNLDSDKHENWSRLKRLPPYGIALFDIISNNYDKIEKDIIEKVVGLENKAFWCMRSITATYDEVIKLCLKLIPFVETVLGLKHPSTAASYSNLGNAYNDKGAYDEAIKWYEKAKSVYEEVLGLKHPDTATSYNNLGIAYNYKGAYDEAIKWYEKAKAIHEEVLGLKHPDTATSYNNLGNAYNYKGAYDEAIKWFEKAIAISEEVLGLKHPSTASSYNNLGSAYNYKGAYDEAIKWYEKAKAIREEVLGLKHPSTASSYNNLGNAYFGKGAYDEAIKWYEKDLAISEEVLGLKHPDTATSYNNLGSAHRSKGDYDEAINWYEKDLAISEEVLGLKHPDTATSYNNLGYTYNDKGDYDEAIKWFEKALVIIENVLGKEHPTTIIICDNYNKTKAKLLSKENASAST